MAVELLTSTDGCVCCERPGTCNGLDWSDWPIFFSLFVAVDAPFNPLVYYQGVVPVRWVGFASGDCVWNMQCGDMGGWWRTLYPDDWFCISGPWPTPLPDCSPDYAQELWDTVTLPSLGTVCPRYDPTGYYAACHSFAREAYIVLSYTTFRVYVEGQMPFVNNNWNPPPDYGCGWHGIIITTQSMTYPDGLTLPEVAAAGPDVIRGVYSVAGGVGGTPFGTVGVV